jgi:hypothetical protein
MSSMISVGISVGSNCPSLVLRVGMPSTSSSTWRVRSPRMSMRGTPSAPVRTTTPGWRTSASSSVRALSWRMSSWSTCRVVTTSSTRSLDEVTVSS